MCCVLLYIVSGVMRHILIASRMLGGTFKNVEFYYTIEIYTSSTYVSNVNVCSFRTDAVNVYPASFYGLTMVPVNVGTWLLVCRNNDHLHGDRHFPLPFLKEKIQFWLRNLKKTQFIGKKSAKVILNDYDLITVNIVNHLYIYYYIIVHCICLTFYK